MRLSSRMEANLCLFCTTPCGPSTFTFVDGQLIRIKNDKPGGREGRRGGDPTHDDYDDCNFLNEESSSLLSEQLKVIFILKKILGIKEEKLLSFLGKLDGHLLPEFWFQVCTSCREAVRNCFEIFKKISFLQKRFATISAELIGNIKKTSEKHEKINVSNKNYEELLALSIWKEIRETVPSVGGCLFKIRIYKLIYLLFHF
ncbi:unnamed protein product [Orchesella dallaii]|uniref:Uncharacterized protein n=1 Tax=Orchesella dallaii TaxID=48710 RepID=A0ABP1RWN9_9HEXA